MDPEKVKAVMSWERPNSVFEICSFLGLDVECVITLLLNDKQTGFSN